MRNRRFSVARWVYVISDLTAGQIKIGCSTNPSRRLKQLRDDRRRHRLLLLHVIPGDPELERELQAPFERDRINGSDWFQPSRELARWIESL